MPDRSRSGALALILTLATVAGAQSPSSSVAPLPAATSAAVSQRGAHTLTLTSDGESAVIDIADAQLLTNAVKTVISSRVSGLDVVQDSGGVKFRITSMQGRGAKPLFIIDGVPVAEGYALSILARIVDRVDVFQDVASTSAYGLRASNGVVMIATARRP